jgi:hypothetical protein
MERRAINCLVRDMTISGAALEVTEPHDVPFVCNVADWHLADIADLAKDRFAPEAANRERHLGEITANFVAMIRRSLFGADP